MIELDAHLGTPLDRQRQVKSGKYRGQ